MYDFTEIKDFKWEELNGKVLKIVSSDLTTVGFDDDGNCFVLHLDSEKLKESLVEEDTREVYIEDGSGD